MQKFKAANIDDYIENFPPEIQDRLMEMRNLIKAAAPDAEEVISYEMPTFKIGGRNLVYFAAFKNHIGFYPFPSGIEEFREETKDYVTSTGTIQFPYDRPIPKSLVTRIVEFRLQENLAKIGTKGKY